MIIKFLTLELDLDEAQFKDLFRPERIQVRIHNVYPLHPLVCRKGQVNGMALRMRPEILRPAGVTQ
jgi:hypothetical protein